MKAYHHGNLHAELITHGFALLETTGDGNISLRELARHVGVTPNAVYRHFADKEALLVALAAEGFRRLAHAQRGAVGTRRFDAGTALRSAGRAYVSFATGNPALFRLMFGRFTATHRSAELMEAYAATEQLLRGFVSSALPPDASERAVTAAAVHAWALVHGLSSLALDGQLQSMSEHIDQLVDAVLEHASLSLVPLRVKKPVRP